MDTVRVFDEQFAAVVFLRRRQEQRGREIGADADSGALDLPNGVVIRPQPGQPLVVPAGAVVVPGARAVTVGKGPEWGLSLATPVIVKYRDEKTDARTELEPWIR